MVDNVGTRGILIDSHVHIYDCFDLSRFLAGAWKNFDAAIQRHHYDESSLRVLMLAETSKDHWFQRIFDSISETSGNAMSVAGKWRFRCLPGDDCAVVADGANGEALLLIAGRQIVTLEKIEILALGTRQLFPDGLPLEEVSQQVTASDALSVVPWGVGKWLGRRGRIVRKFVETSAESGLFAGDIGGRPTLWPRPRTLRFAESIGIKVLPGSDPLPLESEAVRAGECGVYLDCHIDMAQPTYEIKEALRATSSELSPFFRGENLARFLRNQISIRL